MHWEEFHELQRCTAACGRAVPRRGLGGTVYIVRRGETCVRRPETRGSKRPASMHIRHEARGTLFSAVLLRPGRQIRWSASR